MTKIKSFTDLSQSRKLAEILPLESADMYWFRQLDSDYFPPNVESICPVPLFKDGQEDFNYDIRCWSLAALLNVLPAGKSLIHGENTHKYKLINCLVDEEWHDNPIDACVEMIKLLHEQNLI